MFSVLIRCDQVNFFVFFVCVHTKKKHNINITIANVLFNRKKYFLKNFLLQNTKVYNTIFRDTSILYIVYLQVILVQHKMFAMKKNKLIGIFNIYIYYLLKCVDFYWKYFEKLILYLK